MKNELSKKGIKILHCVGGLNQGGVETWLLDLVRSLDRTQYHIDVLVHTDEPRAYDEDVRTLGCKVIPCKLPSWPFQYGINFFAAIGKHGPYDVIHCHLHHFSGYVMLLAWLAGIPIRIVHSRNTHDAQGGSLFRNIYRGCMKCLINVFATHRMAITKDAAKALFGATVLKSKNYLYCPTAIDFSSFSIARNTACLRRQYGIPENVPVIGHVGRFTDQKNHRFLLEIARVFLKPHPESCFICLGDGMLKSEVIKNAEAFGIRSHFFFLGTTKNVPEMMALMDVFVFPSKWEGAGRVIVEAQASGLPCVISDVIPEEVDLIPTLIKRVRLSESPEYWANVILEVIFHRPAVSLEAVLVALLKSSFNMTIAAKELAQIYGRVVRAAADGNKK